MKLVSTFECPCPKCFCKRTYSAASSVRRAIRENSVCKKCAAIGRCPPPPPPGIRYYKFPKGNIPWHKGKRGLFHLTDEAKKKISDANRGKKRSVESRKLMSDSHRGYDPWNKGKTGVYKTNTLRKMRLSALDRLKRQYGQLYPNYNAAACKAIDDYGTQHGYKFQHALNGGEHYIQELGYWVDGYDKEKNVVIEYYEKHHMYGIRPNRDSARQAEIVSVLGCEFIIIKE